ncbi:glutathione S-transferase family protein [Klebsiella variicola]|nr:glutathione S-transferase family protein [Klebsiella variicola]
MRPHTIYTAIPPIFSPSRFQSNLLCSFFPCSLENSMLTIWGRKTSSNVQALMWCVGELGLDYLRFDVGHRYGGTDSEAFYQLNPNRTVPVLQDGDNPPLWETGAILRYLASRYADDAFWPGDLLARTEVDRWAEWSKAEYRPRLYGAGVLARGAHACRRAGSAGHRRGGDGPGAKSWRLPRHVSPAVAIWWAIRSPWPTSSLVMCCTATLPSISPVVPSPILRRIMHG